MRLLSTTSAILALMFLTVLTVNFSEAESTGFGNAKVSFVDADGDGINDNAPDADGDGIPNGKDPDYTGGKVRSGDNSKGFVDANGDGINDNALDDDNDGIPNGQDPDYVKPQDGTGQKRGKMSRGMNKRFVDENGDGINDLALDADGDGIPNCQDPDYVPAGKSLSKGKIRGQRSNSGSASANLAPSKDRLRDGSCGTCDGTGLKKLRRIGSR